MKNIFKIGIISCCLAMGLSSCNDFFDALPGEQYDLESTFTSSMRTEQFLNKVYSWVPDESYERTNRKDNSGIWTIGSIECKMSWSGKNGDEWVKGGTYAGSSWINYWYIEFYKGISNASIFIQNVDRCEEAAAAQRKRWKAEARALRALYYFMIFRSYGPFVILGEDPIPFDTSISDLLKERNSVDECVKFMAEEFDAAAADLPAKNTGGQLGRIDRGACKAFKAKMLLYAASPLFNCNTDYANVANQDGKQLFPQDQSQELKKWEDARKAYEEFFEEFVPTYYQLYEYQTADGKTDFYESYRVASGAYDYKSNTVESIFIRLASHTSRAYETTPKHMQCTEASGMRGGLGFGVPQEMVDLYFTKDGLRIVDDANYEEYAFNTIPPASMYDYGFEDNEYYSDPIVPERHYIKHNKTKKLTLKQWVNREPRFYTNITFNGSTWLNTSTSYGEVTTELYYNGNAGNKDAGHDAPYTGYGMRKMAAKGGRNSTDHCAILLRLADMYLGYAETLSACGEYDEAMKQVNIVRARAGIPGYGNNGGKDANGWDYITYPANDRNETDKRIRRERLVELMFEWNHFFDVRRWKVADMPVGDDWIYPSYHKGGEGGDIHGLDYKSDMPGFFKKAVIDTRVFDKKHYLFPIPDADIRRNPKMVQNYGWMTENNE